MQHLQLPPDRFVEAALDELVTDTARLYDRAPSEDRAFWRIQRDAFQHAQDDWQAALRPELTPDGYLVPSSSTPGVQHLVRRKGGVWVCSCRGGRRFHRHTAMVGAIERAWELAACEDDDVTWGSEADLPCCPAMVALAVSGRATEIDDLPSPPSLDPDIVIDPRDELARSVGAFGDEALPLPFVPTVEEIAYERAWALAADVADWY